MEIYDRILKNLLKHANSEYWEDYKPLKESIKNDYLLIKESKNELNKIFCKHIKKEIGKTFLQKK